MKIPELSSYQELTDSEISVVMGGITVSRSIDISPAAASYLSGIPFSNTAKATYTITYSNGQLSDFLEASETVPTVFPDGSSVSPAFSKSGIIF